VVVTSPSCSGSRVLHEVAAGAELAVVADRGGGGGDLAESAVVSGTRWSPRSPRWPSATSPRSTTRGWHEAAGAELEVVVDRGGGRPGSRKLVKGSRKARESS
jgi:hypothetical protein